MFSVSSLSPVELWVTFLKQKVRERKNKKSVYHRRDAAIPTTGTLFWLGFRYEEENVHISVILKLYLYYENSATPRLLPAEHAYLKLSQHS